MTVARGFILQASYRVATRAGGARVPVIHLYGRLADGRSFLVREDRQRPHFYIRAADAGRARALRVPGPTSSDKRTFDGLPVCRIETEVPPEVPGVRDRLHEAGIETFEADVRFAVRFLIERGIKGGCEIEGEAVPGSGRADAAGIAESAGAGIRGNVGVDCVFDNPILRPTQLTIEPRVLSFDIETDIKGRRLLAISIYAQSTRGAPEIDEVLIVDGSGREMPEKAVRCANEFVALDAFCQRVSAFDPDVITGWNLIDFDLTVLQSIAARVGHPFLLGRDTTPMRLRKAEGYFGSGQATIPGRLVLDGIDLLRGAFVRMDDYSLETVSREVLGEGKAVAGDVRDRYAEISHNYRHDLPAFALYARTDARLAWQIVHKLNLVPLAFARSQLTGMTPDRVAASIASFDFLYMSELEPRGIVTPTVRFDDASVHDAQQGGHVLESVAGLHPNVWVFDFKSLYPSIIRTFNIDPLSYVADRWTGEDPTGKDRADENRSRNVRLGEAPPGEDLIATPGGAFRREPAILPRLLDELFPRREAAKKAGDEVASHAIKILMNSFYGVLGTPACRFYNPALANSITGMGREMLLWSKAWFEGAGFQVLYGDTDSLFVRSDSEDAEKARAKGRELAAALNHDLARHIEETWRVQSRLELKFEKLYVKLFLPWMRHSTRGASKRYAGLRQGEGTAPDATEFVGMEVVRRDWTALAKQVQRELYQRLFTGQAVDVYLADIVQRVRRGELDDALVYRKNLRKDAGDYTASTPPHVAAARKSAQPPRRLISYVITTAGPEPVDNLQHPLDREHYVLKQIKPVAEPVLATLGLDFERVIGDVRQFDLYPP